jgi:thiamine-monophosphate kinase
MKTLDSPENQLIQRISLAFRSTSPTIDVGIGDDAAVVRFAANRQGILTCDWFLEGTHFLRDMHPAAAIGWKCLARALSDVAAMGGAPACFLLSLALPQNVTSRWLTEFLQGLRRAATKFRCPLAGGDTTRHDRILINITVLGHVQSGRAILRSGARPGDAIFVSGVLGQAELGLRLLKRTRRRSRNNSPALKRHLYPEPRLVLGQWLANRHLASAMLDVSDGLSTDLSRLCVASKVGARIDSAKIPAARVPPGPKFKQFDSLSLALNGGDDYELLFTVPPGNIRWIPTSFQGVSLARIGEITAGRQLKLVRCDGIEEELLQRGWDPFRPGR